MRIVHIIPYTGPIAAEAMAKCCDGLTVGIHGNRVVVMEDRAKRDPTPPKKAA